jgi:hypothetical protein
VCAVQVVIKATRFFQVTTTNQKYKLQGLLIHEMAQVKKKATPLINPARKDPASNALMKEAEVIQWEEAVSQ